MDLCLLCGIRLLWYWECFSRTIKEITQTKTLVSLDFVLTNERFIFLFL